MGDAAAGMRMGADTVSRLARTRHLDSIRAELLETQTQTHGTSGVASNGLGPGLGLGLSLGLDLAGGGSGGGGYGPLLPRRQSDVPKRSTSSFVSHGWAPNIQRPRAMFVRPSDVVHVLGAE
jgi:hypothetical protein